MNKCNCPIVKKNEIKKGDNKEIHISCGGEINEEEKRD